MYIYNDDNLYRETKYISDFTLEEREEFEKMIEAKSLTVRLKCRGYRAGCEAWVVDLNEDPPTRVKQRRAHYSGIGENGFREDHYTLGYSTDENGKPLTLKVVELCGCCSHEELIKHPPISARKKQARKELKKQSGKLIRIIILLGDRLHKLKTILTLEGKPDFDKVIRAFHTDMTGREYLECIRLLGSKEWKEAFKQHPNEEEISYETRLKNGSMTMITSALKHMEAAHTLGMIEDEAYETVRTLTLVAQNELENSNIGMPHDWLEDTTEAHVYAFLRPYGYMFKRPWFEALKAAAEEAERIAKLKKSLD